MPWGDNTKGQGPWGSHTPPPRNDGGGDGPDIDEFLRQIQERFQRFFGGGSGSNVRVFLILALVGFVLWLATGIYIVDNGEQGVVLRFGAYHRSTGPGPHYHFPRPIERVEIVEAEKIRIVSVGTRELGSTGKTRTVGGRGKKDSLMLTVHRNIVDVPFNVQWQVKDAADFLFKVKDPEINVSAWRTRATNLDETVRSVAESAMREVVARKTFWDVITVGKELIAQEAKEIMQRVLDDYETGILITQVNMGDVQAPEAVVAAFIDVEDAKQDKDRAVEQANAYRNEIIPKAEGEAEKLVQQAQAYREATINNAQGQSERFLSVYSMYREAKDVTKKRMYLETMETILQGTEKILLDNSAQGTGVVPYLPLPEIQKKKK